MLGSIAIRYRYVLVSSGLWGPEPEDFHNSWTTCLQCYVCCISRACMCHETMIIRSPPVITLNVHIVTTCERDT